MIKRRKRITGSRRWGKRDRSKRLYVCIYEDYTLEKCYLGIIMEEKANKMPYRVQKSGLRGAAVMHHGVTAREKWSACFRRKEDIKKHTYLGRTLMMLPPNRL